MTLVTTGALICLHNLIKQDAYALEGASRYRLQRHVQKLASAAQISFAERTLLKDENRLLSILNNEAKVRRSTRSLVLGQAKVMSYEDLSEARAKRAAKEKASKGEGQRGRKCKSSALEADVAESAARISEPEPVRAPVAQLQSHGGPQ